MAPLGHMEGQTLFNSDHPDAACAGVRHMSCSLEWLGLATLPDSHPQQALGCLMPDAPGHGDTHFTLLSHELM